MCHSTLLACNGQTTITYCRNCKAHYIWQDNSLLTFNADDFRRFVAGVHEYKGREQFFTCPDGVVRMLMPTPLPELALTFTYPEWGNFMLSLEEAGYMMEIYQLVGTH
ncbi:hypothetical protein ACFSQ3_03485 [Sphingobacterium corticis]|uniref:Uncharacterized protein n=1 Tax=Sphingobacterium corticis TaxID=1812823 RepID=A0ABW5NJ03_9SPHI